MRLDKFLKVTRIIKRRPVAKLILDNKKATINGRVAKAGSQVKQGDIIELSYYNKLYKVEVLQVPIGNVSKNLADSLYKLISVEDLNKELSQEELDGEMEQLF